MGESERADVQRYYIWSNCAGSKCVESQEKSDRRPSWSGPVNTAQSLMLSSLTLAGLEMSIQE